MTKNNTNIGFEKQIWNAACVLWGHIPAAEYRKVILNNFGFEEIKQCLQQYKYIKKAYLNF